MIEKRIFHDKVKGYTFCICTGFLESILLYGENEVLSKMEMLLYTDIKSKKKKDEFLKSRYLAKLAIKELYENGEVFLWDVEIGKGVMNNPIILGKYSEYSVSISHSSGYVAVVAYKKNLMVGVDIEPIKLSKAYSNLWLSEYEKQCKPKNMNEALYGLAIWTCKEALGKCVCLGLQVNYDIYTVKSVSLEEGILKSTFSNFHGLVAYTFLKKKFMLTIVLPKTLEISGVVPGGE